MSGLFSHGLTTYAPLFKIKVGRASGSGDSVQYTEWRWDESLSVESIRHRSNGEVNECVIRLNMGLHDYIDQVEMEQVPDGQRGIVNGTVYTSPVGLRPDDMIQVWEYDRYTVFGEKNAFLMFVGFIQNEMKTWSESGQEVLYVAAGVETRLNDNKIRGSYIWGNENYPALTPPAATSLNLIGKDCHFNKDGFPNRSETYSVAGFADSRFHNVYFFDGESRTQVNATSKHWTLEDAIVYLLHNYDIERWCVLPDYMPNVFEKVLRDPYGQPIKLRPTNVDGFSLLEALKILCEPNGVGFRFSLNPQVSSHTNPELPANYFRPFLYFYRMDDSTETVRLWWDKAGTSAANAQLTNVRQGHINTDIANAATRVEVVGDYKRFQGTFLFNPTQSISDLLFGWYSANLDETLKAERYNTTSPEFATYSNVGRVFILNEDGSENITDDDGYDAPYDFSTLFGVSYYSKRKRQFLPPFAVIKNSLHKDVYRKYAEWSPDEGASWYPLEQFVYLPDRCGIRIVAADLAGIVVEDSDYTGTYTNYWDALINSTLQIRVVASVESDERVVGEADRSSNAASIYTITDSIREPRRFIAKESVTDDSPASGEAYDLSNTLISGATLNTEDNTLDAQELAWNRRSVTERRKMHTSFVLRAVYMSFAPGQRISQIGGRGIDLVTKRGNSDNSPMIVQVNHQFGNTQVTELLTETTAMEQVI